MNKQELIKLAKDLGLEVDSQMTKAEIQKMVDDFKANESTIMLSTENADKELTVDNVKDAVDPVEEVEEEEVVVEEKEEVVADRPPLTESQKRLMNHQAIKDYYAGK